MKVLQAALMKINFYLSYIITVTLFYLSDGLAQYSSLSSTIDSLVASTIDSEYAASVFVSAEGRTLLQKEYGWIDSTKQLPLTEKTLFNVASVTKTFTATAIFILRDEGKVNLQDPLPKFITATPRDKQLITIEHLLTHTSGLRPNYTSEGITNRDSAVAAILNDTLQSLPGDEFTYANENYELLAAIVE
ncbi:MAG: class A beta-lactamase-related serine hydrolase, partial [Bacteroidetes bacterium]